MLSTRRRSPHYVHMRQYHTSFPAVCYETLRMSDVCRNKQASMSYTSPPQLGIEDEECSANTVALLYATLACAGASLTPAVPFAAPTPAAPFAADPPATGGTPPASRVLLELPVP